MAFGNGVLMRSTRHWAWARDDGSVVHGRVTSLLDSHRLLRLPVVRSVAALADMAGFAVARHRQNGRRAGLRLLWWLAAYIAVCTALSLVLPALGQKGMAANVALQVAGLALGLVVIHRGMGVEVWRYHGAEHKAVNAFEAGASLDDVDEVMSHSRMHERCGTNLMVIVFALLIVYIPLQSVAIAQTIGFVYAVAAMAMSLELFRVLTKRPRWLVSRAVLGAGKTLQRCVTTREPSPEQLELACRALRRVVELEGVERAAEPAA